MAVSIVGKRYASALFSLGEQSGETDKMSRDLSDFAKTFADSRELRAIFENPSVSQKARQSILRELAAQAKMHDQVRDLLLLLSDRHRLRHIPEVAEAFEAMQQASSGIVRAEVTTATELPDAYFKELETTLRQVTGKNVVIVRNVDPELIGGVVTRIGDRVFDGSLKHRLNELKEELLRVQ